MPTYEDKVTKNSLFCHSSLVIVNADTFSWADILIKSKTVFFQGNSPDCLLFSITGATSIHTAPKQEYFFLPSEFSRPFLFFSFFSGRTSKYIVYRILT